MNEFILSALTILESGIMVYIMILIVGCIRRSGKMDAIENYAHLLSCMLKPIIIWAFIKEYEVIRTGDSENKKLMIMAVLAALLTMVAKRKLEKELIENDEQKGRDDDY